MTDTPKLIELEIVVLLLLVHDAQIRAEAKADQDTVSFYERLRAKLRAMK